MATHPLLYPTAPPTHNCFCCVYNIPDEKKKKKATHAHEIRRNVSWVEHRIKRADKGKTKRKEEGESE